MASSLQDSSHEEQLQQSRVALINLPQMLHEIVKGVVAAQQDMSIVGDFDGGIRLHEAAERCAPDVIITGTGGVEPTDVYRVLIEYPRLRVLAVTSDGRRAFLSEVRPYHVPLGEASPQKLLNVIRAGGTVGAPGRAR